MGQCPEFLSQSSVKSHDAFMPPILFILHLSTLCCGRYSYRFLDDTESSNGNTAKEAELVSDAEDCGCLPAVLYSSFHPLNYGLSQ
jgi:hypothetical protein